jgi:hypothetical protein
LANFFESRSSNYRIIICSEEFGFHKGYLLILVVFCFGSVRTYFPVLLTEILDTGTLRADGMVGFRAYPNYEPRHWIWIHMKKLGCVCIQVNSQVNSLLLPRLLKFGGEILSTFLNEKFLSTP